MSVEARPAAQIGHGTNVVLDGVEWRVTGVKRLPGGTRSLFLIRDGDVSMTTRADDDLIDCKVT